MKGITPLFLGIVGTFLFSWMGLILIPNAQIGSLNPQMEEDGTDAYPVPRSGLAERGRQVYIANGCIYCHSQQVRPAYAGSDIERKWGDRRSAPRDYIFDRPVLLGKLRMGPDLANVGARAPADDATAPPPSATTPAAGGAAGAAAPAAPATAAAAPAQPGTAAPPTPAGPAPASAVAAAPAASPSGAATPAAAPAPASGAKAETPADATAAASPAAAGAASPAAAGAPEAAPAGAPAASPAVAATSPTAIVPGTAFPRELPQYSALWHHRHLYAPRSIDYASTMPSYAFLYRKQRIGSERSADALVFDVGSGPPPGWQIVPTSDAEALVHYLMSLNQGHPLKEVKSAAPAAPATPAAPAAPAAPAK